MSRQRGRPARRRNAAAGRFTPFFVCLAFFALPHPAGALWREFALGSDRSDDPVILDVLRDASLDERLEILEAVGARADPFLGAYLEDFLVRHTSRPSESEHLMRVLLDAAFPRSADLSLLSVRVAANQGALLAASARLPTFTDSQLCAAIVRIIPLLPGGRGDLLGAADRLAERLAERDGLLDPRENALLLDVLEAMGRVGSPDFLEPALAIARLSREKIVVERARKVARALAFGGTGR
jgi:hypothetical protein